MRGRIVLVAVWLAVVLCAQEIHLKTRTVDTRGVSAARRAAFGETPVHQIVQFDHPPSLDDLDGLAEGGAVVNALPDNAVVAVGRRDVFRGQGIRWIGILDPADKLSPDLPRTGDAISALVEFYPDVEQAAQNEVLAEAGMAASRPAALLPAHVIVTGTHADFERLAQRDEVDYVFPADMDLLQGTDVNPCEGMLTMAGPIAQYANIIHGWDLDSDRAAHLYYVFGSLTPRVPAGTVQTEVFRALNEWARVANVTFQPGTAASAARTIAIRFVSGAHGDAYPFDGPGGTLAHTFYPVPVNAEPIAGDMHLDADENWHAGGDVDIYSVALHEAGHALGLGHSDKPGDVMYPYYRRGMTLSANDIGAARSLYGAPSGALAPVTSAVPTLHLSVAAAGGSTQASTVSFNGTVTGGSAPYSVQWISDQGYGGRAGVAASGAWTASGIPLVTGVNTISLTGFDAANRTVTQTLTFTKTVAPIQGVTPVAIAVTSGAGNVLTTSQSSLSVSGVASGGSGIARVVWQTAAGAAGTATGTERWSAGGIPLLTGTNTLILRAYDLKGATAWTSLVIVRR